VTIVAYMPAMAPAMLEWKDSAHTGDAGA
jgi:hypothetical protein